MFDSRQLVKQFDRGKEVEISFQYMSRDIENDVNSLLAKALSRFDKVYLFDTFESVLREIIQNALKANMKRVYFDNIKLNIDDPKDYEKGMNKFKDVAYHPELLKEYLMESRYRVAVKFRRKNDGMEIDIVNNIRIVPSELERLHFRQNKAMECSNFAEAYENIYDASEGAGLGIILSLMLIKNAGLDMSCFNIIPERDSMKISLTVPMSLKSNEITSAIRTRIINDVNSLPTFPKNIIELQMMCGNPDISIETISEKIGIDPSLTADVLKISNSVAFITGKRIKKISEAIKIIGMKNLNSILIAAASRKILDKRYRKFEQIWDHCNKAAFYARYIAQARGYGRVADSVFLGGLLHDIGKIVLLSTNIELVNQIAEMVRDRKIRSSTILEEISIGISHSTIGAQIAEKWNFPDELIEAIKYHHSPLDPGIRNREVVMIVYLANQITSLEAKDMDMLFFESDILDQFKIGTRDEFEALYKQLKNSYSSHLGLLSDIPK